MKLTIEYEVDYYAYAQFALPPGKESPYIFSKFNPA